MARMIIYEVDPRLITIDAITDIMSILCINAADVKLDGQVIEHDDMEEAFDNIDDVIEVSIDPVKY